MKKESKVLAAQVVAYRALGLDRDGSILAMQELVKRKEAGDEFDYEKFIADELSQLAKPTGLPNISFGLQEIFSGGLSSLRKK